MGYFCYLGCSILTAEISLLMTRTKSLIDLRFLPAGFHEQPSLLNKMFQIEIDRIEEWNLLKKKSPTLNKTYDAILLGLGLCNQATAGLYARTLPLVIPRAHDCITLLLGSKEKYLEIFQNNPGNYWYSAGWIERMMQPGPEKDRLLKQVYVQKYGPENSRLLLEAEQEWQKNYRSATNITWKLPQSAKYREYTKTCAAHLNWSYQEIEGDPRLLKDFLNGVWDDERFLVVNPGEMIEPSYDTGVIKCGIRPADNSPG